MISVIYEDHIVFGNKHYLFSAIQKLDFHEKRK
jgi:hypothetical protein